MAGGGVDRPHQLLVAGAASSSRSIRQTRPEMELVVIWRTPHFARDQRLNGLSVLMLHRCHIDTRTKQRIGSITAARRSSAFLSSPLPSASSSGAKLRITTRFARRAEAQGGRRARPSAGQRDASTPRQRVLGMEERRRLRDGGARPPDGVDDPILRQLLDRAVVHVYADRIPHIQAR